MTSEHRPGPCKCARCKPEAQEGGLSDERLELPTFSDDEVRQMTKDGRAYQLAPPFGPRNVRWLGGEVLRLRGELETVHGIASGLREDVQAVITERDDARSQLAVLVGACVVEIRGKDSRKLYYHCLVCGGTWEKRGEPVKDVCDDCGLRKEPTSYDREYCTCKEATDGDAG